MTGVPSSRDGCHRGSSPSTTPPHGTRDPQPQPGAEDEFVGRQHELGALEEELRRVRGGQPRVVLIQGPAGIGKTALVQRFLLGHEDLRVFWGSGEEWEASFSYGLIDQLLGTAGMRGAILLASERALPVEAPIAVGRQILKGLAELNGKGPVVLVVDDGQWADVDSLRALLFALRRLVTERVLTFVVTRSGDTSRLPQGLARLAGGRTGSTLSVGALAPAEIQALAAGVGVPDLPALTAHRLCALTEGNPAHVGALLAELPPDRWRMWEPVLPAPRMYSRTVVHRLNACSEPARRLVEAASVLGEDAGLGMACALGGVEEPLVALEEAYLVGLLDSRDGPVACQLAFPEPLVRAAVYAQLGPARRMRLHLAAAELIHDERAALHHRVAAVEPPNAALATELEEFAARSRAAGERTEAAWDLLQASRLSQRREERERRLLCAVDLMGDAGDVAMSDAFARDIEAIPPGPLRDVTAGHLALLRGRSAEADESLRAAWMHADPVRHGDVTALIAQRLALHALGRLRGAEVVDWSRRAIALPTVGDPGRAEAQVLLRLGEGLLGRAPDGTTADGCLGLVVDEVPGVRAALAEAAYRALRAGSVWLALWAFVWSARAGFAVGAWDEAAADAERAVSLLGESGHEWLRPLARFAAVLVPAARGEWVAAEEHARAASARSGDYELMVVAAGLAAAQVAAARGDHAGVLRAMEPVVGIRPREGVDEPGVWPWQDVYGDALVSAGRLEEAEVFLRPHEELAAARGRASVVAGLARVRGRLEAARGRGGAAEEAFVRGLGVVEGLALPFQRALLELAYGQTLRRGGQRRAAAERLAAARERLVGVGARPYVQRCERELGACGLAPAKRSAFDPSRLTAQESEVARLVAGGMSNRQVASELFVSVKTVQFHLTHIYSKVGVGSRAELAARLRDDTAADIASATPGTS